jgi:amino acid transporter
VYKTHTLFIVVYIAILASVIALRHKYPDEDRPFSAGGPESTPAVAVVGIVGLAVAMFYSGDSVLVTSLGITVGIFVLSVLLTRFRSGSASQETEADSVATTPEPDTD